MQESEILSQMRQLVGEENLISSCSGGGCRVYLTDIPPERLIVDVDRLFDAHGLKSKRCDRFVLFTNLNKDSLVVVLIELKSGGFNTTDVFQQLQLSADFISGIIPKGCMTECIPILFHGKGMHKVQNTDLRRSEVLFRGEKVPIRRNNCGTRENLANVLRQAKVLP
ncbi:MAG: hypothetical protein OXI43_21790 [Candidatus Poribacteria bacterium]|nr:hypothetical protein [Candidatus Poribacteria bacterium]